jgi:hypothetical protein
MHELGHNFGLVHSGCPQGESLVPCPSVNPLSGGEFNYKPNYFSVMNYLYQSVFYAIPYASERGSTTIAGYRLDYSEAPSYPLDENHLDENVGINAGTTDIVPNFWAWWKFQNSGRTLRCADTSNVIEKLVPASGPIDWDCDGQIQSDAAAFLLFPSFNGYPYVGVPPPWPLLASGNDWAHIQAQLAKPSREIEAQRRKIHVDTWPNIPFDPPKVNTSGSTRWAPIVVPSSALRL